MTAEQPDPIVITGDHIECEEDCATGTFNWTPGTAILELLNEVDSADREALVEMLSVMGHHVLGVVAASVMAYDYSEDDSALEKAQNLLMDAIITLQAEYGVMQMEVAMTYADDEDDAPDAP